MNRSLTHEEINRHRHLVSQNDHHLHVTRYEIEIDPIAQKISEIVLTGRSTAGATRRLRFTNPQIDNFGPLQVPTGPMCNPIYIVDIAFKGWAGVKVEVGSDAEDRPTFFFAERVEEVTDP